MGRNGIGSRSLVTTATQSSCDLLRAQTGQLDGWSTLCGAGRDGCGSASDAPDTVTDVAIYALGDQIPDIHPDAFVHPDAVIIGSVTIGAESSIWPCAVLRGDAGTITIGARTSIQDGAVIHTTEVFPTTVGDDCVIGHIVHLEGCTIESGALIGSGSVVLHQAVVQTGALVAANSTVLNKGFVPSGALAVGSPVVIKEGRADPEMIRLSAEVYVHKARWYRTSLRRLD
jgi:carbonic anhydrase/acetyltransferase-like protein (isoleucine patch superfamily)